MNIPSVVKSAVALAALSLPSIAFAAPGYMADVKIALTISYERDSTNIDETSEDGTRIREQMSKLTAYKYGTRELLEDLLEAGRFPDGVESIKGWSLKEVSMYGAIEYYLFNKDTAPVLLEDEFSLTFSEEIYKRNLKLKQKRDDINGPFTSATSSGSILSKGMVSLSIGGKSLGLEVDDLTGKGTTTTTYQAPAPDQGFVALRTLKTTSLGGGGYVSERNIFAEGSVATTKAVLLNNVQEVFEDFPYES